MLAGADKRSCRRPGYVLMCDGPLKMAHVRVSVACKRTWEGDGGESGESGECRHPAARRFCSPDDQPVDDDLGADLCLAIWRRTERETGSSTSWPAAGDL